MPDAKWLRNSFFYLIVLILLVFVVVALVSGKSSGNPTTLTGLLNSAKSDYQTGHQPDILLQDGQNLTLTNRPNQQGNLTAPMGQNDTLLPYLQAAQLNPLTQVTIKPNPPSSLGNWVGLLGTLLPVVLIGGFLIFMMRQAQGSNNQALSFGKSRARMFTGNRPSVTFQDVAGVEEAKQELAEVVEFLKYPQRALHRLRRRD